MSDAVIRISPENGTATLGATGDTTSLRQRTNRIEGTIEAIVDVFWQQTRYGKNYAVIQYDERNGLSIVFTRKEAPRDA